LDQRLSAFKSASSACQQISSAEEKIDLKEVQAKLVEIEERIKMGTEKHNEFLRELGLKPI